jgi:hypothetical protein
METGASAGTWRKLSDAEEHEVKMLRLRGELAHERMMRCDLQVLTAQHEKEKAVKDMVAVSADDKELRGRLAVNTANDIQDRNDGIYVRVAEVKE